MTSISILRLGFSSQNRYGCHAMEMIQHFYHEMLSSSQLAWQFCMHIFVHICTCSRQSLDIIHRHWVMHCLLRFNSRHVCLSYAQISPVLSVLSGICSCVDIRVMWGIMVCSWAQNLAYLQISNISCTLVGNKIVDHSDVVGASPVGAVPTTC